MKKVLKNRIFLCLIVGICCLGIGVYGANVYQYNASDVLYNSSNGETINVNEALNELYDKYDSNGNNFILTATLTGYYYWDTGSKNGVSSNSATITITYEDGILTLDNPIKKPSNGKNPAPSISNLAIEFN